MNRRQCLLDAEVRLTKAGIPDARLDAEWMLAHALNAERLTVLAFSGEEVPEQAKACFDALVARREAGEPLQYALGEAAFMGRVFCVDRRVLIPRPDTETLAEAMVQRLSPGIRALDIGTGSGALAITAALACEDAIVTGADISPGALEVARRNGERLGAAVRWVQSDLFDRLPGEAFDLIVSNPPYIRTGDLSSLQREVRKEPRLALDGGEDGFSFYRKILAALPARLTAGGSLLFEVGDGQAGGVASMMADSFETVQVLRDLFGTDRVVTGDGYAG